MKLTKYEKDVLKAVDSGQLKSIPHLRSRIKILQKHAREDMKKDKRVNLRLSRTILEGFRHRSIKEGIPYQTLMTSVLYKFIAGSLTEKED